MRLSLSARMTPKSATSWARIVAACVLGAMLTIGCDGTLPEGSTTIEAPGGPIAALIPVESARFPGASWDIAITSAGSSRSQRVASILGSRRPVLRWESVAERVRLRTGLSDPTGRWVLHVELDYSADLLTSRTRVVMPSSRGRRDVAYVVFDARMD